MTRLLTIFVTAMLTAGFALAGPSDPNAAVVRVLENVRKQHNLPAVAAVVIRDGRVLAIEAVGVRKRGDDTPVTRNDQFHLGSCTKAMTATLIAMLVERGKLDWDTTIGTALPEMPMSPQWRDVTLRHLLMHRAGLPTESWPPGKTFLDMHNLPGSPREQRRAYTRMMLAQPPAAEPGTKYVYANAGYTVAAVMAEAVMDRSWETMMREMLFEPLGMSTAGFGAMGSPERIDQPWQHRKGLLGPTAVPPGPTSDNPPVIGPGGTVHCSMADWAKFILLHLDALPGERLLRLETIRQLHQPDFGGDYAGGWLAVERRWAEGRILTHAGSNTMNFAVAWIVPESKYAVLAATNQGGGNEAEACDAVVARLIELFPPATK